MRAVLKQIKKSTVSLLNLLPVSSITAGVPRKTVSVYDVNVSDRYVVKDAEQIRHGTANLNNDSHLAHFDNVADRQSPKQIVSVLDKGRVWGRNGAVVTKEDEFVFDVSREFGVQEHTRKHSIYHNFKLGTPNYIDANVAVVTTAGANVYYHWMLDILPRILMLKKAGCFEEVDYFVLNYEGLKFQKDTLAKIGVEESQIINCKDDRNFHIKAKKLYVPTLLSQLSEVNRLECEMLREVFLDTSKGSPANNRVYVSRKKTGTRTIVNESEILEVLEPLGFQKTYLEDYSIEEQASIFYSSEVIVGAHGSAYANMAFASSKTKLVDIIPETNVIPCFYNIAEEVGAEYYGYIDEAVPMNNSVKNDSIKVDIPNFVKFLNESVSVN